MKKLLLAVALTALAVPAYANTIYLTCSAAKISGSITAVILTDTPVYETPHGPVYRMEWDNEVLDAVVGSQEIYGLGQGTGAWSTVLLNRMKGEFTGFKTDKSIVEGTCRSAAPAF
jgi:hypothetical protein